MIPVDNRHISTRKHSSKACERCRAKKLRCEGGLEDVGTPCRRCVKHSAECLWTQSPKGSRSTGEQSSHPTDHPNASSIQAVPIIQDGDPYLLVPTPRSMYSSYQFGEQFNLGQLNGAFFVGPSAGGHTLDFSFATAEWNAGACGAWDPEMLGGASGVVSAAHSSTVASVL